MHPKKSPSRHSSERLDRTRAKERQWRPLLTGHSRRVAATHTQVVGKGPETRKGDFYPYAAVIYHSDSGRPLPLRGSHRALER